MRITTSLGKNPFPSVGQVPDEPLFFPDSPVVMIIVNHSLQDQTYCDIKDLGLHAAGLCPPTSIQSVLFWLPS